MAKLFLDSKEITNVNELEEGLANIEKPALITTLDRDEVLHGLTDLVAALSANYKPLTLADVSLPAGLLVWDFISAAGLTDFAEEIMGPDLYGKIQDQIGSGDDEA